TAISNLKVRFSAGETGNQEIGQYQSLATLSPINYDFNSALVTGFAANRLSNPNLKWEKTAQFDGGFDLGLLNNRVNLVFDAYYKKTNNLLLSIPIPLSTGYSSSLQNIGSVENKGVEIGINTENINGDGFTWKSSIVYSLNRNKVLSLGNSETSFFPNVPNFTLGLLQPVNIKVGLPLGTFWGYETAGIFQNAADIANSATLDTKANTKPGDRKYVDVNGDGKITAADKVALGNPQPKFIGSFTNTFAYKHFDLLIFLQGSYGSKIYNALQQQLEITNLTTNAWADVANRWTPANPSNSIPRASNSPVAQMSDRYIQDASYLRLKNLVLGYNFSNTLLNKIYVKQVRVYVAAQNLVTWTKYKGYDPEVNSFEQNNTAQGIDYGAYPNYRTFLLGLNVTL
ncbi:MAG: SusC/RagA family TonB-linked outer membrane protein, partial [Mucilaginibacter sp.]